jgi:hypothetical protein
MSRENPRLMLREGFVRDHISGNEKFLSLKIVAIFSVRMAPQIQSSRSPEQIRVIVKHDS